jgi:hypothetical protein
MNNRISSRTRLMLRIGGVLLLALMFLLSTAVPSMAKHNDIEISYFYSFMHISVKSHSEIGPCRTVRGEKSAVVEIVPQVCDMVRFARIFLCDSPFSSSLCAL